MKKIQDRLEVPDPFAHEVEKRIEFQKSFVTEVFFFFISYIIFFYYSLFSFFFFFPSILRNR